MTTWKVVDTSKAICFKCGVTSTTFQVRDVPVSGTNITAPDLLVGVCDRCDSVVSVPQQSTPQIWAALAKLHGEVK